MLSLRARECKGSVSGHGASQESSQSSNPGVLTPPGLCTLVLLFSHFIQYVSLAPSFLPDVILFPPVSLSGSDWVTCRLSPVHSSSSPSPSETSILLFPTVTTRWMYTYAWRDRVLVGTGMQMRLPRASHAHTKGCVGHQRPSLQCLQDLSD